MAVYRHDVVGLHVQEVAIVHVVLVEHIHVDGGLLAHTQHSQHLLSLEAGGRRGEGGCGVREEIKRKEILTDWRNKDLLTGGTRTY